ncbi:MAG: excinuclease ABC subunit UvrC [Deltaproteobacteria bacterium]|nr:excinuclease ABC subunit UvrC [Deltaproteobacteria bacterium]
MPPRVAAVLAGLPDSPGVYLHKDADGRVLYVGKAKSLRQRVRSYFQSPHGLSTRIAAMVAQVADIGLFVTRSETEALLLEASLIKKHQPRYNVLLKDDRSYPFFKLTSRELFPRLMLVRETRDPSAEYFGPYTSVKDARETLHMIHRYFKLRTSKWNLDGTKTYRPCLNWQMGKCLAPCRGEVDPAEYRKIVNQVRLFFLGRDRELINHLEENMNQAAQARRYEEAAACRDAVRAVTRTLERQRVVVADPDGSQDVFAVWRESRFAGVEVMFIRNGRLIGHDCFFFDQAEEQSDGDLLKSVLNRLYTSPTAQPPREVVLPVDYEDRPVLAEFLSDRGAGRVKLTVALKGEKRRLVEMGEANARLAVKERMVRHVSDDQILGEVRRSLHLRRIPRRVEAFDISNIQGRHQVASMVSWNDNRPDKDGYRKFKIQTVVGPDDFASMEEVLTRRYTRLVADGAPLPDLILIDGGKGQVNMAWSVLEKLGISPTRLDLIGLAKGRTEKRRAGSKRLQETRLVDFEYVVKPQMKNEITLKRNSPTLHFLQRIRDETHRFAITYHRALRSKSTIRSGLDHLPGIGPKRVKLLLRHFGSLKRVGEADLDELLRVPGLPPKLAAEIYQSLGAGQKPSPASGLPETPEPAGNPP